MVEDRVRAADARPTEDELQAMARQAYAEKLAQFCDDQRAYPHHAVDHERANRTWADYYDRLVRNGGHAAMLDGEEQAWRMMGWDAQRVANLRVAIAHVEEGQAGFLAEQFGRVGGGDALVGDAVDGVHDQWSGGK